MHVSRRWVWLVTSVLACGMGSPCLAQPRIVELEGEGTIDAVSPDGVRAIINNNVFLIGITPQSKVSVKGTASRDMLVAGTPVAFTADLDDKGKPTAPVDKIAIFASEPPGIHAEAAFGEQAAKPARRRTAGTYRIVGTLRGMSPSGDYFVAAGSERVTVTVGEQVAVDVDSANLALASQGDAVRVKGKYRQPDVPPGAPPPPLIAEAEELSITLSKPIAPKNKKRAAAPAARPAKKQPAQEAAEGAAIEP